MISHCKVLKDQVYKKKDKKTLRQIYLLVWSIKFEFSAILLVCKILGRYLINLLLAPVINNEILFSAEAADFLVKNSQDGALHFH